MEATADIGLIGLAVMGQNLVLNMNDHGFVVSVYNRTVSKVDDFLANEAKGTQILGAHSIQEFVSHLKRPRRVMLLVKAGQAVDDFIEQLLPIWNPVTSLLMGVILSTRTACAERLTWNPRAFNSSAPVSVVEKRVHVAARPSCRVDRNLHGLM